MGPDQNISINGEVPKGPKATGHIASKRGLTGLQTSMLVQRYSAKREKGFVLRDSRVTATIDLLLGSTSALKSRRACILGRHADLPNTGLVCHQTTRTEFSHALMLAAAHPQLQTRWTPCGCHYCCASSSSRHPLPHSKPQMRRAMKMASTGSSVQTRDLDGLECTRIRKAALTLVPAGGAGFLRSSLGSGGAGAVPLPLAGPSFAAAGGSNQDAQSSFLRKRFPSGEVSTATDARSDSGTIAGSGVSMRTRLNPLITVAGIHPSASICSRVPVPVSTRPRKRKLERGVTREAGPWRRRGGKTTAATGWPEAQQSAGVLGDGRCTGSAIDDTTSPRFESADINP